MFDFYLYWSESGRDKIVEEELQPACIRLFEDQEFMASLESVAAL